MAKLSLLAYGVTMVSSFLFATETRVPSGNSLDHYRYNVTVPVGSDGSSGVTIAPNRPNQENPGKRVQTCYYTNLPHPDQSLTTIRTGCRGRNGSRNNPLDINQAFLRAVYQKPFLAAHNEVCAGGVLTQGEATAAYRQELLKRLTDHCAQIACERQRLGANCEIARGLVDIDPTLLTTINDLLSLRNSMPVCESLPLLESRHTEIHTAVPTSR